jgi:DNA-binding IclR family transcriptional regulator
MATGFRTTQALYVVAKLGTADLIATEPKTSNELAQKVGAHPDSLFTVMRALASLGLFTQDLENRFGLTPLGSLL